MLPKGRKSTRHLVKFIFIYLFKKNFHFVEKEPNFSFSLFQSGSAVWYKSSQDQ